MATANTEQVEAPVTIKAYLMCAFAAFGGIFFGYDSGYINGVMGMDYFIQQFEGLVSRGIGLSPVAVFLETDLLTRFPLGPAHHTDGLIRHSIVEKILDHVDPVSRNLLWCADCR
jgi:hypothetical protein